jgi:hypothetical protein
METSVRAISNPYLESPIRGQILDALAYTCEHIGFRHAGELMVAKPLLASSTVTRVTKLMLTLKTLRTIISPKKLKKMIVI